jgi:hypothetical protein
MSQDNSNSNSYGVRVIDDGGNNTRVQISGDRGSIYDSPPATSGEPVIGGINSGRSEGETAHQSAPNAESNSYRVGPSDLGGFTARTPDGWPILDPSELTPDSIVTVNGFECEYRHAKSAGLLRDGANGARPQSEQEQQDIANREKAEQDAEEAKIAEAKAAMRLDETTEQLLGTAFAADAGTVVDAAQDFIATGDLSTASIERLADANGATPDQVRAAAAHIIQAHTQAVISRTSKASGFDPALVHEALAEAQAQEATGFNEARYAAFDRGQYSGFTPYVTEWAASFADTPEGADMLVKANPGKVRLGSDGRVVVRDPSTGYEISWRDAVMSGRFRFNPGR